MHEYEPKTGQEPEIEPLFDVGQIVATRGFMAAVERAGENPFGYLVRHVAGDWGDLPEEDIEENRLSLEKGYRIFSAYHLEDGTKFYLITEWDRSVTTFLLPDEY